MTCPPGHSPYHYEHTAAVATDLHRLAYPRCPGGFQPFKCGDHWHVGHRVKADGDRCKAEHPTDRVKGAKRAR